MKKIFTTLLALLPLLALGQSGQPWSSLRETLVLSNSWIVAVAVPGVTNYKFTIGTLTTQIVAQATLTGSATNAVTIGSNMSITNSTLFGVFNEVVGQTNMKFFTLQQGTNVVLYRTSTSIVINASAPAGSGGGSLVTNANQFGANPTLTIKDAATLTNVQHTGVLNISGSVVQLTAFTNLNVWSASNYFGNRIQIASGSPGAGKVLTSDASGNADWQTPVAGGSTFSNKNVFYVSMTGDNSTAKQGRLDLPYRDPMAAQIAAAAAGGGTVTVFPGLYTTNNLATNLVDFCLLPGAIINFVDNGSGPGKAIFDDRGKGAVTTKIWGAGDLRYSTGLTGYNVGTINITSNPTNVNNLRGAICVTNALSDFNITLSSITVTTLVGTLLVSGVYVADCSNVVIHCPRILDGIIGRQFYIGDDDGMNPVFGSSGMSGVYWEKGPTDIFSERIQGTGYAIYAFEGPLNAATQHLHVTSHTIESFGPSLTVYLLGSSNAFKVWITAHEIVSRAANAGTIGAYGDGRFYITAQKISSPSIALFSASGNQQTWITSQRVASGGNWAVVEGGKMDCLVGEWDDDGGLTTGWQVTRGELIVHDGEADVSNGRGLAVTAVGKAFFRDMHIDTHLGNLMTNVPVFVSTNGVILQNCVLVAPTAAPAIMAVGAQSVVSYGIYANKTNHPNITLQVGAFASDTNVR